MGKIELAIETYLISLKKNPNQTIVLNNLAIAFQLTGQFNKSVDVCLDIFKINSNISETHNIFGNSLRALKKNINAEKAYKKAIDLDQSNFNAFNNLANLYVSLKNPIEAIKNYTIAFSLNNRFSSAYASLLDQRVKIGDWSAFDDFLKTKDELGIIDEPIQPFLALNLEDNPENQMKRSINFSINKNHFIFHQKLNLNDYKNKKIRIGYFSSDFYDHATIRLIKGLLISHNKSKFEIYLFSYGNYAKENFINDIIKKIDAYLDVSNLSDFEILKLTRQKKIDIAIDLKGYTEGSRSKIFSYRLSPIQINYLGYPGTMGSKYIDYIIADKTTIPEHEKKHYTEKIIYMPDTYQPNDDQRKISCESTLRSDHNLSEKSFVLCCFNNNYKITPKELVIWLKIMKKNQNCILWLLDTNSNFKENIKNFFIKHDVDIKQA